MKKVVTLLLVAVIALGGLSLFAIPATFVYASNVSVSAPYHAGRVVRGTAGYLTIPITTQGVPNGTYRVALWLHNGICGNGFVLGLSAQGFTPQVLNLGWGELVYAVGRIAISDGMGVITIVNDGIQHWERNYWGGTIYVEVNNTWHYSGIRIGVSEFASPMVLAGYEPTIRAELGNNNPARTRDSFISRGTGAPYYYNGRLYTRAEFFDAHNGGVFSIRSMNRSDSRARGHNAIWIATRQAGQISPPVRIDGGTSPSTPTPDVTVNPNVPNSTQPSPEHPQQPPATPQAPVHTPPVVDGAGGIIVMAGGTQRVQSHRPWNYTDSEIMDFLPLAYANSEITLPNRRLTDAEMQAWIDEYWEMGGMRAFELEVIRLTNLERTSRGLNALEICYDLSMVTRFYTQTILDLGLDMSHHAGPYGSSGNTAAAFGIGWSGANGSGGSRMPHDVVSRWMRSPGHRDNILSENTTHIGFGTARGNSRIFHYQMFR